MSDVVERAKEALEGTTDEPWVAANDGRSCSVLAVGKVIAKVTTAEDAVFIAAARSLVPELIAEVERLRDETEKAYSEGWWQGRDDTEEAGGV